MTSAEKLVKQADAIADGKLPDEASVDLRSYVATYKAKREAGDDRAQRAWARAVVNQAAREEVEVKGSSGGSDGPTVKELKAEIDSRNEGRKETDLIVPEGKNKAALLAALEADDAAQSSGD